MKFRFPVVIIDEDFRSENISGSGIRALAEAIEKEGAEVLGVGAATDAELHATLRENVERRHLLGDAEGMVEGQLDDAGTQAKARRARGNGRQQTQAPNTAFSVTRQPAARRHPRQSDRVGPDRDRQK